MNPMSVDQTGNDARATLPYTLKSLLLDAQRAQERASVSRSARTSRALTALVSFARNVDRFSQALDVYVQGGTAVGSIIWGSLRVFIKVGTLSTQLGSWMLTGHRQS